MKGKLVYCKILVGGAESVVKGLGGIGAIVESSTVDFAEIFMAPGTLVNTTAGLAINDYIHSNK